MAGIGVKLNKIYEKNTIVTEVAGATYSTIVTIAPMIIVMVNILLMGWALGFSKIGYASRELFSSTVLYIFIFSLVTAAPFNAVISRFMSDVIYEETFEDILACFYTGLVMNLVLGCILSIPFCIREYLVGKVEGLYVLVTFWGFLALVLVFYNMLYLSICKDYAKISKFFLIGMAAGFLLAFVMVRIFSVDVPFSMLCALTFGFFLTACLEMAQIKCYFKENSRKYGKVLSYFKKYWALVVTNLFYILGLYVHNFVFWTSSIHMVVAKSFVSAEAFDMATYLALLTNISATVIFISNVEMRFHDRYKNYSEAVIGGRLADIERAKKRMFRQLDIEIMNLVRIQFIITAVLFLFMIVVLPQFGIAGMIMQIYPCLAAAYFVIFVLYSCIIFLYYFNDLTGAVLTALTFFGADLVVSILVMHLSPIWFGLGAFVGAILGWAVAYYRLQWVERNIDIHIFCTGKLIPFGRGKKPSDLVYSVYQKDKERKRD